MLRSSLGPRLIGIGTWRAKFASTYVCRGGLLLHQTQTETHNAVSRGRGFSLNRRVSAAGSATSGSRGVEPGVGAGANNDASGVPGASGGIGGRGGANVVNPRGGKVNEPAESANQMYRSADEGAIPLPQEKQAVDMDSVKGSSGAAVGSGKTREDDKSSNPSQRPRASSSSGSGSGIGRSGGVGGGVGSTSGLGGSTGTSGSSSAGSTVGKLAGPRGGGPASDTPIRQVSNNSSSSNSRSGQGKEQERQNLKENLTATNEERQGAGHTRSGTTPTSSERKRQQQQQRPLAAEERERARSNQMRGSSEHQQHQQQQHEGDAAGLSSISSSNSTFSSMDPAMAHRSAPDAADRPQGSPSEQFVAADRAEADPLINRTGRASTSPQSGTVPDTRGL